ncbi:hypothetical protein [Streptomyces sp. NPDC060027]
MLDPFRSGRLQHRERFSGQLSVTYPNDRLDAQSAAGEREAFPATA